MILNKNKRLFKRRFFVLVLGRGAVWQQRVGEAATTPRI